MKLKAFTLAELLIALAIIGILLILTIPRFVDNMTKKNYVAALQRIYLSVSDSVKLVLQDERTKDLERTYLYKSSGDTVTSTAGTFLKKYFKISVDCQTNKAPCFANSYASLDGSNNIVLPNNGDVYCVTLTTNASVCISPLDESSNGLVIVDVNGTAKPNVAGMDLFRFNIYPDGFVGDRQDNSAACESSELAVGCFNKLVEAEWTMNY